MHFLNIEKLKQELRADSLSEHDTFVYFFAGLIVNLLEANFSSAMFAQEDLTLLGYSRALMPTVIAVTSTWILYHTNGGRDGTHFFLRYFSILWVIGVRFFLLALLLLVGSYWFAVVYIPVDFDGYDLVIFLFQNILYALFYWRVWVHMREMQSGTTT